MQDDWSEAGRDPDDRPGDHAMPAGSGRFDANEMDINQFDVGRFDLERFNLEHLLDDPGSEAIHRSEAPPTDPDPDGDTRRLPGIRGPGGTRWPGVAEYRAWARRSRRGWLLGGATTAVVVALGSATAVVLAAQGPPAPGPVGPEVAIASPVRSGRTARMYEADPPAGGSAGGSAMPSRSAKPDAGHWPSRRPTLDPMPPPPPRPLPSTSPAGCPWYAGAPVPRSEVRARLEAAANWAFWPNSAPALRVPRELLAAIAWQESAWQSTLMACDGGIGLMQVMPDIAGWANYRFVTSWDVTTPGGNVMLGAQYLSWLIKYTGDVFYGGLYDVTKDDGLLNAVISGYHAGYAAVDPTRGDAGIPNWRYVNSVRALMVSCPCDAY